MSSHPPSDGVLESFLRDMAALDHLQQTALLGKAPVPPPAPKKRTLEAVSASHKPTTRSNKKKRVTPSWLKTRNELQTLRQQAEAMETRVKYLETKNEASTGCLSAFEVQKLKSRAVVEEQWCRDALHENEQLKAKLQLFRNQSQAFQRALKVAEYQQKQLLDTSVAFVKAFRAQMELRPCSTQVFDMLERRIDARLSEVEEAFRVMQGPMTSVDTDVVQTWGRKDDHGLGSVEFSRLELLPFEEGAISYAMWSFIEMGKFPAGERSVVMRRTEDGYALTSRVTVQTERGGVITIESHGVIKRYMMPQGVAIMCESCSDWTATFPDASTWSHTTREESCFVMRNYSSKGESLPGICQARSVVRLHPGQVVETPKECSLSSESTINGVVIPSFRQLVHARHQFVHNALFDTICGRNH
ncbi:uncharacterized protein KRP23_12070 [Phytophthora ramorum]|uniref:uncharacterized protein n=1 Tax=Phytophthora ramorum TaxID=164328 RepID=UPI0030AAF388|nr:hypothetical protein KRP23_12070 [Phytophthora ramorum]